jgi:hypothetical protein
MKYKIHIAQPSCVVLHLFLICVVFGFIVKHFMSQQVPLHIGIRHETKSILVLDIIFLVAYFNILSVAECVNILSVTDCVNILPVTDCANILSVTYCANLLSVADCVNILSVADCVNILSRL